MKQVFTSFSILSLVTVFLAISAQGQEEKASLPPKEKFHLFILAGQSNMAGRGKVSQEDLRKDPRVLMFTKEQTWVPAVDPLHFDKPRIVGVGLGKTFGIETANRRPGITIGLIPCAAGGSPIQSWEPGGFHDQTKSHPWDDMATRVRSAMKSGTLKGVLWHQGESDGKEQLAPQYERRLHALVTRFRTEFQAPALPFIVGQMGQFPERPWNEYRKMVDAAHRNLPNKMKRCAFVSSDGLDDKGDLSHFNSAGYRELGKRFAKAYQNLCGDTGGDYFFTHIPALSEEGKLSIPVTYAVWIPRDVAVLRGVIVHQHGCGTGACQGGRTAAFDLHWQALARKWNCALLGPSFHQQENEDCRLWCDPRNGSGQVFTRALRLLGKKTDHPELAEIPWCLWGHSGGGFWASLMQMIYPERIIAIWFQSGTAYSRWVSGEIEAPKIPDAAMKIPMTANPGYKEKDHHRFRVAYRGSFEMVKAYRARGAPICFAPDPLSGHETRDSRYLAIPFFDASLALRLPEQPGETRLREIDLSTGVYTRLREDYTGITDFATEALAGAPEDFNWLPNADFAAKWAEFLQTGEVKDATPPPRPTKVQLIGNELRWSARADFESGIQRFVICRDGKEIASIPGKLQSRFGRPLYQGMSYHDTPQEPIPEMRFLIDPAMLEKGGVFSVETVNSAGLRSEKTPTNSK